MKQATYNNLIHTYYTPPLVKKAEPSLAGGTAILGGMGGAGVGGLLGGASGAWSGLINPGVETVTDEETG